MFNFNLKDAPGRIRYMWIGGRKLALNGMLLSVTKRMIFGSTFKLQVPFCLNRFYSILDMSQDLIFIHVSSLDSMDFGTLYTSGSEGVVFSESMERHLFTRTTLTDFYRVKGMRGVFITSKVCCGAV